MDILKNDNVKVVAAVAVGFGLCKLMGGKQGKGKPARSGYVDVSEISSKQLASLMPTGYWFEGIQQSPTSESTNTVESKSPIPICYKADPTMELPYPDIHDDTEGVPAFDSMNIPSGVKVFVDVGGGAFNSAKEFLEKKHNLKAYVVDPFRRSASHNKQAQAEIEANGGADMVSSVSVLNVVPDQVNRLKHIGVVYTALKKNGIACFKVWAGSWPNRGTGISETNDTRKCYQANAWASYFVPEVALIFGSENVFADNNANCIMAKKTH
eukprot:m.14184 g.14184  ORF g.14184 m.14184 type:complete len:268 (+) comp5031_c0_seq1:67-870(+)